MTDIPFSESAVERTVVDRFVDMIGGDLFRSVQIGNGAGDAQNAVVSACAEPELGNRVTELVFRLLSDRTEFMDVGRFHPGVAADPRIAGETAVLEFARFDHACPDPGARFSIRGIDEFILRER